MKLNEILSLVQPLSDKIQDTKDVNEGLQGQIRSELFLLKGSISKLQLLMDDFSNTESGIHGEKQPVEPKQVPLPKIETEANRVAEEPIKLTTTTTQKMVTTSTKPPLDPKYRDQTIILVWEHPSFVLSEGPKEGPVKGGCYLTYDKSVLPHTKAVYFEYTALNREEMPWKHYRDPDQVFVWRTMESPVTLKNWFGNSMSKFDNHFINWTMTYRDDSDVFCPYIYGHQIREYMKRGKEKVDEIMASKSRVAIWVVSNCGKTGSPGAKRRMAFVEELIARGLPVHRFGRCFDNKEELAKMPREVSQSYKFYLSFENSYHCKDYITEKFWFNAIMSNRVPVVWGPSKEDVLKLAPPNSFVHADDFESADALTKYLLYLDKNATAYRQYFKWIEDGETDFLKRYDVVRLESLCQKITSPHSRKTVSSVSDFFLSEECIDNQ